MIETSSAQQFRKTFIQLGLRRAAHGTGSAVEFLQQRTASMKDLDLRTILHHIPWAVIGGVATRAYMAERSTLDVDILIHRRDGQKVAEALHNGGFIFKELLAIGGSTWESSQGLILDVVERADEWVEEALATTKLDPQGSPVISLPYLVLMKLQASRAQDLADITRMLGWAKDDDLHAVRSVITKYQAQDAEDLESLIRLGKLEQRRNDTYQ